MGQQLALAAQVPGVMARAGRRRVQRGCGRGCRGCDRACGGARGWGPRRARSAWWKNPAWWMSVVAWTAGTWGAAGLAGAACCVRAGHHRRQEEAAQRHDLTPFQRTSKSSDRLHAAILPPSSSSSRGCSRRCFSPSLLSPRHLRCWMSLLGSTCRCGRRCVRLGVFTQVGDGQPVSMESRHPLRDGSQDEAARACSLTSLMV